MPVYYISIYQVFIMVLKTERVLLRPFQPEDAKGLFEMDSNPEVHRFLGNNPLTDIEKAKEVVSNGYPAA